MKGLLAHGQLTAKGSTVNYETKGISSPSHSPTSCVPASITFLLFLRFIFIQKEERHFGLFTRLLCVPASLCNVGVCGGGGRKEEWRDF